MRFVVWCVFVLLLFAVNAVLVNGVSSEVATDLAMEQLENPSVETSTASKSFGRMMQFPLTCLVWAIGTLIIFWKPLKTQWVKFQQEKLIGETRNEE